MLALCAPRAIAELHTIRALCTRVESRCHHSSCRATAFAAANESCAWARTCARAAPGHPHATAVQELQLMALSSLPLDVDVMRAFGMKLMRVASPRRPRRRSPIVVLCGCARDG
jgi:hypothetical protein